MSSTTPNFLGRLGGMLRGNLGSQDRPDQAMDRIKRLGLSQRQQHLNRLWAVYCGMQYAHFKVDWNGKQCGNPGEDDFIASQGFVPPGFIDASGQGARFPLKYRRPNSPYGLVKVIVDRYTGLLFSEQQHPEIKVDGDPATEDWLRAVAEVTRLWQLMILSRQYGGAMGSSCIGFQFLDGKPAVEVHDPRWVVPEFAEHGSTTLVRLEKRYTYPKEARDPSTGKWEMKEYWYRRIIDEQSDILFKPALVDKGEEPAWEVEKQVDHGLGFCPVVWVQNMPVQDGEDGEPDCDPAVYENVRQIDMLLSQATRAILANCDPQLVITGKNEMGEVKLSGDSALRVPDGDAKFLEVQASGPKASLEHADQLRKHVLEMTACVLEHPDVAGKTATEVERMYQSMLQRADIFREQYGQKAIVPLLEMMYRAAKKLSQPTVIPQDPLLTQSPTMDPAAPSGETAAPPQAAPAVEENDGLITQRATMQRGQVQLPPRYELGPDGVTNVPIERVPGEGGTISLQWPGYFQPTLVDVKAAVEAATAGMSGSLIDDETAVGFVAPFFKVEDKTALLQKVRANAAQKEASMMAMMQSGYPPMDESGEQVNAGEDGGPPPGPKGPPVQ